MPINKVVFTCIILLSVNFATHAKETSLFRIAPLLKGNTEKLKSNRFQKAETKISKYYLLYFSASWCPPCRKLAPKMVNFYNESVKNNQEVEMVMFSLDKTDKAALKWAKEENFPWAIVLSPKEKVPQLMISYAPSYIPYYVLVDKRGKIISQGEKALEFIKKRKL